MYCDNNFNFIVITFYNVYNNYIQFSDFVIITLWLCEDNCYSWERLLLFISLPSPSSQHLTGTFN